MGRAQAPVSEDGALMDDDLDSLSSLWKTERSGDHTAKGRRKRELKSLPYSARRKLTAEPTKSAQMNLKVTPEFKALVASLALAERVSMVEYIERAIKAYSEAA